MKVRVELTLHQTETWLAVLSVFDPTVVNEAVVKLGLSEDPFPDLGKLVSMCNQIRRQREGLTGESQGLGTKLTQATADALGLKIQ